MPTVKIPLTAPATGPIKQPGEVVKVQKSIGGNRGELYMLYGVDASGAHIHIVELLPESLPPVVRLHMKGSTKEYFNARWDGDSWIIGALIDWQRW